MEYTILKQKLDERAKDNGPRTSKEEWDRQIADRATKWKHEALIMDCIEEMCELTQLLSKHIRYGGVVDEQERVRICEELVDITISQAVLCKTLDIEFEDIKDKALYISEETIRNDVSLDIIITSYVTLASRFAETLSSQLLVEQKDSKMMCHYAGCLAMLPMQYMAIVPTQMAAVMGYCISIKDRMSIPFDMILDMVDIKIVETPKDIIASENGKE